MTPTLVLVAALAPAAPVPEWARVTPASELKRLEGRWAIEQISSALGGGVRPQGDRAFLVFRGARVDTVAESGAVQRSSSLKVDPRTDPRRMTLVETSPPATGITRPGVEWQYIYELSGNDLRLACHEDPDRGLPARIDTTVAAGQLVLVLRRVREVAPPPRPARRESP